MNTQNTAKFTLIAITACTLFAANRPVKAQEPSSEANPAAMAKDSQSFLPQNQNMVSYQNRLYPLEPIHEFMQGIQERRAAAGVAQPLTERTRVTPPSHYSLAYYQTPVKDQLGRGSCWAFGSIAALEAAYKRKYGVTLDLSEQYAFQVGKAFELYGDYTSYTAAHENNSSYWGFQNNSGFISNMIRAAVPEERFAPYRSQIEMDAIKASIPASGNLDWNSSQEQLDAFEFSEQNVPTVARWNAKYRPIRVSALSSTSTDTLERVISSGKEVVCDFNLRWKSIGTRVYDHDATSAGGGHVMLLVGYNRNSQRFICKNSWGDGGLIQLTYNFVRNNLLAGNYIEDVAPLYEAPQAKAAWIGNWNMDNDGQKGRLVIRRFTNFRNSNDSAPTKLGNYYVNGRRYDVNGFFADGGRRMVMFVAGTTNRVQPGTLTGSRFDPFVFSYTPWEAAGVGYWNNTPFGMKLSRYTNYGSWANAATFSVYRWLGTWYMNHDGWQGRLVISNVTYIPGIVFIPSRYILTGYYVDAGNTYRPINGTIYTRDPHSLRLYIGFPGNNQAFDLYHHTWENGVFSGQTYWGGSTFGVSAHK